MFALANISPLTWAFCSRAGGAPIYQRSTGAPRYTPECLNPLGAEKTETLSAMTILATRVSVRVAVQSPQRLLRDTLAACLAIRPDVTVVGRVAEADEVSGLCELSSPDVVILDAGRQVGEMAGRVRTLVGRFPELNVIVVYREASGEDLAAACQAGVSSLVPESHGLAAVLAQVRRRRAQARPGGPAQPRPPGPDRPGT